MPNYVYKKKDPQASGCDACSEGFMFMQRLSDDPLERCPECETAIRRAIGRSQCMTNRRWNTKKMLSDGNLKRLGFKKMVKEGDGKYRDVLAD